MEISRIESGALRLNKEDFSLAYIIADAVKDARAQSVFDPDKLSITYNPDDIFVNADREKTTQVLANLLTNAIKFTKAGTISITTERDRGSGIAVIKVKDSGIGLFISKKIIEAHGGTIEGKNNDNGNGSTFSFTLPVSNR